MVVDDRSRHELYRRLEEVLGLEAATTLIEHLPPAGWAEVAPTHDLANLEERLELGFAGRFAAIDGRFDRIDERFSAIDERFNGIEERFKGLDWRFEGLDDRLKGGMSELRAAFEHELRGQTTTMVFGLVSVVLTMAALAFALARFT